MASIIKIAPPGKFIVVGYDSFSREEFPVSEYYEPAGMDENDAKRMADEKGGEMTLMYVMNDAGTCVYQTGRW